jgi:hypothetical protein
MILAVVIIYASKTGRTGGGLGGTAYFVNKCSQMIYWSNEYKCLVAMVEFRPVGDL